MEVVDIDMDKHIPVATATAVSVIVMVVVVVDATMHQMTMIRDRVGHHLDVPKVP